MGVKGVLAWKLAARKSAAYLFRGLNLAIIRRLAEKYDDPQKIYQEGKKIARMAAEALYIHYLSGTKAPARSLEELAPGYNLGVKFFTGKTFDEIETRREGKDFYITFRIYDCPLCKGVRAPVPVPICVVFAGTFEWIESQRLDEWNAESVTCDETRCRARGDECCEFVAHIRLK